MVDALIQAQASQLAELRATRRYLETGKTDDLTGPEGSLAEGRDQARQTFVPATAIRLPERTWLHGKSRPARAMTEAGGSK